MSYINYILYKVKKIQEKKAKMLKIRVVDPWVTIY